MCVCTISFLVFREHRTPNSGSDSASDGSTQNIQKVVPLRVIRSSFILHALCSTNLPHPTDCAPNNHKVNYLVWLRQMACGCHILTLTLLPWDLSSNCSGEWLIVLYPILAEIPVYILLCNIPVYPVSLKFVLMCLVSIHYTH